MMSTKVYLAFDERMALHKPLPNVEAECIESDCLDEAPYERPSRIQVVYNKLRNLEAIDGYRRFIEIPCIPANRATIELAHSSEHYDKMFQTTTMTDEELRSLTVPNDLYFGRDTFLAASLAVGGVVECVNAVTDDKKRSSRAIAIVRPPGHHATRDEAMGKFVRSCGMTKKVAWYILCRSLLPSIRVSTRTHTTMRESLLLQLFRLLLF